MALPFRNEYPADWKAIANEAKDAAGRRCIRCNHYHCIQTHHVLTVHHFDGDKANCLWWNLLALCQRCHLHIQGRVNPHQAYMFEHSEWLKPYVAGFYAYKYQDKRLTREQVAAQMDELLLLERQL